MNSYSSAVVSRVESCMSPRGEVMLVDTSRSSASDSMDLIELARQIQKANEFTRANATNKLLVIAEQARFLQEQARHVLEQAKRDDDLHHVACNFQKRPEQSYYLYRRESGQRYFSMVSPQEWGANCPHDFLGVFRLERDMSWTDQSDVERKDNEMKTINKILDANSCCNLSIQLSCNE